MRIVKEVTEDEPFEGENIEINRGDVELINFPEQNDREPADETPEQEERVQRRV